MGRALRRLLRSTLTIALLIGVACTTIGITAYAVATAGPATQVIYAAVNKCDGTMKIVSAL